MRLKINRIAMETKTKGLGKRYCLWVQGYSIRCKGCRNHDMWSSSGGRDVLISDIVNEIFSQKNIEGIAILEGETFD